jgi:hypothetical protein
VPLPLLGISAAHCLTAVNSPLVVPGGPNSNGKPSLSAAVPNLLAVLTAPPIMFQAIVTSGGVSMVPNRLDMTGGAR